MHDHPGRLVEHHQVRILVEHLEGKLLRDGVQRHRLGQGDVDQVPHPHRVAGFGGLPVDHDVLLADQGLNAAARKLRQAPGQESIQTLAGGFIDAQFHVARFTGNPLPASFKFASGGFSG